MEEELMCNFFSFVSDGKGRFMYFDWKSRSRCLSGELKYNSDSHTSIADFHGYKGKREDDLNKYEYNPLTKVFTIDQLNTNDDSKDAEEWVRSLDFSTVIPVLINKPIFDPRSIRKHKPSAEDIALLQEWASVRASVWDLVLASVGDSVWDSVRDSVRASVWDLVLDSVLVWAYTSSFFSIAYKHDYSSAVKLWERGLVPSFDGKIWRLHSGKKMDVVYEQEAEKC